MPKLEKEVIISGISENNWWEPTGGVFKWPDNVVVKFDDGEVADAWGSRNSEGVSLSTNEDSTLVGGSPCHKAMAAAGIELERVSD